MCVLFVLRQVVFVNIFSAFAILGSFPAATFDFSLFFRFTSQAFPPSRFWLARIAGVLLRVGAKSDSTVPDLRRHGNPCRRLHIFDACHTHVIIWLRRRILRRRFHHDIFDSFSVPYFSRARSFTSASSWRRLYR